MTSRRALVTGGAGFIGSHLTEALLARGWSVAVLDDLSTGRLDNLRSSADHPRFVFETGSVTDRAAVRRLTEKVDAVFHLAAAVGVRLVMEQPVHTIRANVLGTDRVLECAARRQLPVLLASTSEVYAKSGPAALTEDDDLPLGPTGNARWSYAASKIVGESLAMAYARERDLPVVVARIFNAIGPRQTGRYGMVVPRFVGQALAGEPLTVYGDGSQRRSFAWVGDVVDAAVRLIETPAAHGRVFNVGHDEQVSILELARLVRERARSRSEIRFIPFEEAYEPRFEDIAQRRPDLARIRRTIGYEPSMDLAEIVALLVGKDR